MKKIENKLKTGWELHQLMGRDPSLRWFLNNHREMGRTGIIPPEFKQKAEEWLRHDRLPTEGIPGVSVFTLIRVEEDYIQKILQIFKDYGVVEETATIDQYRAEAIRLKEERNKNEIPF
jgi:hypothetical protein